MQGNFDTYRMVRLAEAPKIDVHLHAERRQGLGRRGRARNPADRRRRGERDLCRNGQAHSLAADHRPRSVRIGIAGIPHNPRPRRFERRLCANSKKVGATPAEEAGDVTTISRMVFCGLLLLLRSRRRRGRTKTSVRQAIPANIWRGPAIALPAIRSPAARRSPAASRWARRSAPFTRPTSRPIPRPASAATVLRISIARCAKASPRTATGSIRQCLIRPTPSSPMPTWRRSTTSS